MAELRRASTILPTNDLRIYIPLGGNRKHPLKSGEELYHHQIDKLSNAILIDDRSPQVNIESSLISQPITLLKFPKDSYISGSFVMAMVAHQLSRVPLAWDDIDVYFKSKECAIQFLTENKVEPSSFSSFENKICSYGWIGPDKYNLIYGVPYDGINWLIGKFDIRACSMAIDPNKMTLYVVEGSIEDATQKRLVFNPVPRGVSMRRYAKYLEKGFKADSHQNLFFVELLKTDIYSPELELHTKQY